MVSWQASAAAGASLAAHFLSLCQEGAAVSAQLAGSESHDEQGALVGGRHLRALTTCCSAGVSSASGGTAAAVSSASGSLGGKATSQLIELPATGSSQCSINAGNRFNSPAIRAGLMHCILQHACCNAPDEEPFRILGSAQGMLRTPRAQPSMQPGWLEHLATWPSGRSLQAAFIDICVAVRVW